MHAQDFERHMALARSELPGEDYVSLLTHFHALLEPRTYVEIGVASGKTLRLAHPQTRAIGVDPAPNVSFALADNARVYRETSDAFFARDGLGGTPVNLGFIDGMHLFEFALRDFINLERCASPRGAILIHDCYPIDAATAARERGTVYWTGDVWRTVLALRRHRPDLAVHTLASPPSGLALITRLDPRSDVLTGRYDAVVDEMLKCDYAEMAARKAELLNVAPATRIEVERLVSALVPA